MKIPSKGLDMLKYEVANELGVNLVENGDNGNLTTREVGLVGGNMVRKLVAFAEKSIADSNIHIK